MLEGIKSFFDRNIAQAAGPECLEDAVPSGAQPDRVPLAACALLLELAHADDEFTADERAHIEEALVRHFDLEPDAVTELIQLAEQERTRSVDLYQFTKLISEQYDLGQKMVLAEIMWRVVYADGELAKHESYLMRKLSNLLGIKPGYLADARKKVRGAED
jgi:uncharacterized tellurite resistance protein B-like protein